MFQGQFKNEAFPEKSTGSGGLEKCKKRHFRFLDP